MNDRDPRRDGFAQPSESDDDVALVRRAASGERQAVERLLERLGFVRQVLVSRNARLGSPLEASELEDVLQETLIAVWNKLERFRYGRLEAWVHRFAVLELLVRVRASRQRPLLIEEVGAPERTVDGPSLQLFELERVYEGLEELGPPENDVIRLKLLEGLTFDEIAARARSSPNTIKARYYRGLLRLRGLLARTGRARSIERARPGGAAGPRA